MMVRTAGLIGAVALGSGLLSACYYEPPPVTYAYVPCPPGAPPAPAAPPVPGDQSQATPPPATAAPPAATAAPNEQCVVAVQNYAYPGPYWEYYPYYPYYPYYYPPASVGVGVGLGFGGHH